jgi:surface protein
MAFLPVAFNTGSTISGTTQYGNVAVGSETFDISNKPGNLDWYYAPSDAFGWTIITDTGTIWNSSNPIPTFWRADDYNGDSLITLVNQLPTRNGILTPITTSGDATSWLTTNGYYNSTPISYRPFISNWRTTTANETIILPFVPLGRYEGTINWGDNSTSDSLYQNRSHTYLSAGTYTVTISGRCEGFTFEPGFGSTGSKITKVTQWGDILFQTDRQGLDSIFQSCSNLDLTTVSDIPNTSGFTAWGEMFRDRTSTSTVNRLNEWDSRSATYTSLMFNRNFTWNQNIGNWNVGNVQSFYGMFYRANQYNNGGSDTIKNWNTGSATTMQAMFYQTQFNQPITGWNVSNVTNMSQMFQQTPFNYNINSWNVSKVTTMGSMFYSCTSFNQPLSGWSTSAVTDMSYMFYGATAFNQDIGSWDVSNVTNFTQFMGTKTDLTFSTSNLDSIYNGWSSRPVQPNISISFGSAKYTAASAAGRTILTSAPNNWTIVDGGQL